jgi:hypothetical protein
MAPGAFNVTGISKYEVYRFEPTGLLTKNQLSKTSRQVCRKCAVRFETMRAKVNLFNTT